MGLTRSYPLALSAAPGDR